MRFQHFTRGSSLFIFLLLMVAAISGWLTSAPLDFFLRLDPALATISAISGRYFLTAFIPALIVLLLPVFLGRFFCGHICPLGTTLDISDSLFCPSNPQVVNSAALRKTKYLLLFILLFAALFGISLVFWVTPLGLITRFYGLLIQPLLATLGSGLLDAGHPFFEWLDISSLLFIDLQTPQFSTQLFILVFFIALAGFARLTPRFWCRYLCPAGALMALASAKPFVRRQVSNGCTQCGECVHSCPMSAIDSENSQLTAFDECIVCLKCETICPEGVVSFATAGKDPAIKHTVLSISRRGFLSTAAVGSCTALIGQPGLNAATLPLRPPAAVPESSFLERCIRCGECMLACPTNTLQPVWFEAGFFGMFSPILTPRIGFCDPNCHQCGNVCPTDAIRALDPFERVWAKTGTATIAKDHCLAWEQQKNCMVCDEVCPFDAIEFASVDGNPVTVPFVREDRCAGCGYCEYHCPVKSPVAIAVSASGALRLSNGSYKDTAKNAGLHISLDTSRQPSGAPESQYPGKKGEATGFDSESQDSVAPGFTE
jgi:ferredoxin